MDDQGDMEAESRDDGKIDKNPFDLGASEDKKVGALCYRCAMGDDEGIERKGSLEQMMRLSSFSGDRDAG